MEDISTCHDDEEVKHLIGNKTDDGDHSDTETVSTNKPSVSVKCLFIVLMCVVAFGDYFIEDNPAALQSYMLKDLEISEESFAVFYSSTSWMNTISGALSGYILDRLIGYRLGVTVFLFGIVSAQTLFGIGALIKSYWTMVAGRSLLGFCAPLVAISADVITVRWFKGSGIATVLALRTSIARAASVIQLNCMDRIYDKLNSSFNGHACLGMTLIFSATVCLIPAFTAIAVVIMDKRHMQRTESRDKVKVKKTPLVWINDIKRFDVRFWFITLSASVYYIGIFPFVAFGQIFYKMKYNVDIKTADDLNSLVYLMAAITLPIFGFLSDKVGRNIFWVLGGTVLSITGHLLLAFTFANPYVATVILGTGYSITTATIWPLAAYVIEERNIGTAFSIMNTGCGVFQAGMQYVSGYLVDTEGYFILEVFFVFTMSLSFLCSCLLYLVDAHKDGYLNSQRAVKQVQL